jgi:hypothetical protein
MLNTAAKLRVQSAWDVETTSTVVALRTLARRAHAMQQQARELQKEGHVGHGAQRVTLRRRRLARPRHLYRRPGPRRFRLVVVAVRILVDKQDPRDIAEVAPLQDALRLEAADQQPHVPLSYDTVSLDSTRAVLLPFD